MKLQKIAVTCGIVLSSLCAQANIVDIKNYQFDSSKIEAAPNAFHFMRSFVDYFYLIYKNNPSANSEIKKLEQNIGWCAGDAHAENFGVLILKDNSNIFTVNDFDDSDACPIALDLYRFIVTTKAYNSDIEASKIVKHYLKGLNNETTKIPDAVQEMFDKSVKRGLNPDSKKVANGKFVRSSLLNEVSAEELKVISSILKLNNKALPILDAVSTRKVGGGSGGLLRYEVLTKVNDQLIHLELKEITTPATYPVSVQTNLSDDKRYYNTMAYAMGNLVSPLYQVIEVGQKTMLLRPKFDGNVGVSLDKNSESENEDLIKFEAYTLGKFHARSVKNTVPYIQQLQQIDLNTLDKQAEAMSEFFYKKFDELK